MNPFLDISLRSLAVYVFMLVALRLFGKNQLSQLNAGDVVLLLLISNAVQNAMVGPDTSLQGGLVAASILFLANFIVKKIMFRSQKVKNLLESEPYVLVRDGKVFEQTCKKVEISEDELLESVHEHGIESIKDVKLAVLEVDGNISVISQDQNGSTHYTRHKKWIKKKRNL
ncbi:YetF domain-containing protein [Soonwooa sp.]|uniref:DUF421 domain-containing protein n=1 Tax=Soonwooa sp. TaxID=1938592 RepID=UPI0026092113|nr:YetF domain-containing protein [Soonwooa sp.]